MKKWNSFAMLGVLLLSLSGCGLLSGAFREGVENAKKGTENTSYEQIEEDQIKEEFKERVLTTNKYKIEIESAEVAPDYDKKGQIVVLSYSFTNNSEDLLVPERCFSGSFGLTQELEDTIEDLAPAYVSYDSGFSKLKEKSLAKVKPGKTITTVASYKLKEETDSVLVTAYSTKNTLVIGEEVIEMRKKE
ncbi:hypothetical protein IGI37_002917 [Enterococcus sp. AZ194]|uniref:DUF5067 domain-containing protein n=1 Tax=Enterococcus sp. AZ194 TaxID=2774629 RepID=UPI003F28ED78